MSKVLIICNKDWADEFSIHGFSVYESIEEWNSEIEKFKNATKFGSYYFGTNEGWDSDQIEEEKDNWFNTYNYKVKEIADEEYEVLKKKFMNKYSKHIEFGHFIHPRDLYYE